MATTRAEAAQYLKDAGGLKLVDAWLAQRMHMHPVGHFARHPRHPRIRRRDIDFRVQCRAIGPVLPKRTFTSRT
jgi:hypothetical protein